ncbi:hypothetical protein LTR78_003977 [Recurvomyces mirabilis]|uniref:Uncharacterized protein n=1 Tax=Recurvomyces mirabilis TaxID=574656 RepID=A0AAE1C3C4_9PEZI|nr:hypothetical protein LTR78_003977 [Recurvomyces mirabilis]KAK5153885.1 hypothetical protein LTS14_007105 [Recurvomyces mirabilis]
MSRLLELPPELRIHIYELVLQPSNPSDPHHICRIQIVPDGPLRRKFSLFHSNGALASVCRTIRTKFLPDLYASTPFYVSINIRPSSNPQDGPRSGTIKEHMFLRHVRRLTLRITIAVYAYDQAALISAGDLIKELIATIGVATNGRLAIDRVEFQQFCSAYGKGLHGTEAIDALRLLKSCCQTEFEVFAKGLPRRLIEEVVAEAGGVLSRCHSA